MLSNNLESVCGDLALPPRLPLLLRGVRRKVRDAFDFVPLPSVVSKSSKSAESHSRGPFKTLTGEGRGGRGEERGGEKGATLAPEEKNCER